MSETSEHRCDLPVRSPYKSIHTCSCEMRWICIDVAYRFPDLLPYSIYKTTLATERWPMWLRVFG